MSFLCEGEATQACLQLQKPEPSTGNRSQPLSISTFPEQVVCQYETLHIHVVNTWIRFDLSLANARPLFPCWQPLSGRFTTAGPPIGGQLCDSDHWYFLPTTPGSKVVTSSVSNTQELCVEQMFMAALFEASFPDGIRVKTV